MIERWQRIPIRWKASGALLVVLGLLTGLWGSLGWPWPTRELAFRMAERARAFGPGEIVAQGELTYAHDWDGAPKGWMVSRSGDAFLVLDLYRRWGLWYAEPYLGGGEAWTAEGSAPLGSVLLADERYTSTAIESGALLLAGAVDRGGGGPLRRPGDRPGGGLCGLPLLLL